LSVVSVAGLDSASLSNDTATHKPYKNNKKVWDSKVMSAPITHQPAIETTQC
jgi:hypothetical protein